jgi:glycine cleavage system H protein
MFDLLSMYTAKSAEYLLAVGYLLLFIPFWRYATSGPRAADATARVATAPAKHAAAHAARPRPAFARPATTGWFTLAPNVQLHPGHTWARVEPDGVVTVGIDDFAHKLVGPASISLPALGARVAQGEAAFELGDEKKRVAMLSPVDGTVVAVNKAAEERAGANKPAKAPPPPLDEPYGAGWLYQVKAPRLAANLRQLLRDGAARRYLEEASDALAHRMSPELGLVLQDGGTPVHGVARALAGEEWDVIARQHFLT